MIIMQPNHMLMDPEPIKENKMKRLDVTKSDFDRRELQGIRERSRIQASVDNLNPSWKRAYQRLGDAADHLDASQARCTVGGDGLMEGQEVFDPKIVKAIKLKGEFTVCDEDETHYHIKIGHHWCKILKCDADVRIVK